MEYTTNLNLSKPSYDDDVDIQQINRNMDIIDKEIKKAGDIDLSKYALKKDYLPLAGGTMTGNIQLGNLIGLLFSNKSSINFSNTNEKETLNMSADKLNCSIGGKPFVIEGGSITYDGNDLIIASKGTNFVKLSNGLTFQWGYIGIRSGASYIDTITLNTPMTTNNYIVVTSRDSKDTIDINESSNVFGDYTYSRSHTVTNFQLFVTQPRVKTPYAWLAIGGI